MKTINLPEGNAFGVDDDDSGTPIVDYAEHRAKTLFFVWVTLTEHKWVIFGERRGPCFSDLNTGRVLRARFNDNPMRSSSSITGRSIWLCNDWRNADGSAPTRG